MTFSPEVQAILDRVYAEPAPVAKKPSAPRKAATGERRVVDYKAIQKRWKETGEGQKALAEFFNCSHSTIQRALREVRTEPSKYSHEGKYKRLEKCHRGHSEWKELKGGGRLCRECKRTRERNYYQEMKNSGV